VHAVDSIRRWGEENDWQGYDPYDALNSPAARWLTLGTSLGRRLLTQAVKRSPVNLRPLLGIPRGWNPKAVALVASGYARLAAARRDESAVAQGRRWLDWLLLHPSAGGGLGWGYNFDVQTRFFAYAAGTPNTIATSFAAHALLDGAELLDEPRYAAAAEQSARFLVEQMLEEEAPRPYFRYLSGERALVHNANLLACSVVARSARVSGGTADDRLPAAVGTSLEAQRSDGSWPYGATSAAGWVDNFHTGYVLESLGECERLDPTIHPALERGFDFWERQLFLDDGTPKYTPRSTYPIDAHNYAQAIETWLSAAAWRDGALAQATRCARLLTERMLNEQGFVDFQQGRLLRSRVPFVRWTSAPSFRALARLEQHRLPE
jgi:polysaccharide biosynthesis protein VpsJ